jgi:hypothetical protein
MRSELQPYLGKTVFWTGFMESWKDDVKRGTRRLTIRPCSVYLYKEDAEKIPHDLVKIAHLHHVNLFSTLDEQKKTEEKHAQLAACLPWLDNADGKPERCQRVEGAATVIEYTRANGSKDYGLAYADMLVADAILANIKSYKKYLKNNLRHNQWQEKIAVTMALQHEVLPQLREQLSLITDRSIPLAGQVLSREDITSLFQRHIQHVEGVLASCKTSFSGSPFWVKQMLVDIANECHNLQKPAVIL